MTACPLCGSEDLRPAIQWEQPILRCHECGCWIPREAPTITVLVDDPDHDYVHESAQEAYDNDQRERFGA